MKLLLDTHLLIWALAKSSKVSKPVRALIEDPANELLFSVASIWELSIKYSLKPKGLIVPYVFHQELLDLGYEELPVTGEHALAVISLPQLHKDPFDRILIAQATVERALLLTVDSTIATYPGPIRKV